MATSAKSGKLLVVGCLILLAAAAAVWIGFQRRTPPPAFNATVVQRGDILQAVTATGDLQPVVQVEVSSQVSGIIEKVTVDFNSPVKSGDIIAQLDPATYDSRLKQARAQLANTRANHALMQINHDRIAGLAERNLVSRQELDQARAQLQQAEAQLLIQQAVVENAETDLARCTITAPIDGVVISRVAERGMTVAASLNAPTLFVIANDLAKMQIVAAVSEADIGSVAVGQQATFTVDAYPGRQFRGRVAQIRNAPVVVQNVVSYNTLIDVANDDLKLRPGMTANISIILARREKVLRLANSALRARIPDELLPPPPPPPAGTEAARPAQIATREQAFAILQEAGFAPGSGRPSPDVLAKARAIAQARGLELPQRGGDGGRSSAGDTAPVTRTVYRLQGPEDAPQLESVTVQLGITDGAFTEVLSGLDENDRVVTGVAASGTGTTTRPGASPFGGGFRRF